MELQITSRICGFEDHHTLEEKIKEVSILRRVIKGRRGRLAELKAQFEDEVFIPINSVFILITSQCDYVQKQRYKNPLCDICLKTYTSNWRVNEHIRKEHPQVSPKYKRPINWFTCHNSIDECIAW